MGFQSVRNVGEVVDDVTSSDRPLDVWAEQTWGEQRTANRGQFMGWHENAELAEHKWDTQMRTPKNAVQFREELYNIISSAQRSHTECIMWRAASVDREARLIFLCVGSTTLSLISDDARETSFLFQRLSVSIQRFNDNNKGL